MRRPAKTYRLRRDVQSAIEVLADVRGMQMGQVIEVAVEAEARAAFGPDWRERIGNTNTDNAGGARTDAGTGPAPARG